MLAIVGPLPKRIAELAWRQHGVVARRQLLAAGAKPSTITLWVEAGHLHSLHSGVYAVGHRLLADEGRWMAAVLAAGERGFLSHAPAGQLAGIVDRRDRTARHGSVLPSSSGA